MRLDSKSNARKRFRNFKVREGDILQFTRPGSRGADVLSECEVIGRDDTGVMAVDADATNYQSFDDKEIFEMLVEGNLTVKRWVPL